MNSIYKKAQDREQKISNDFAFLSHLSLVSKLDQTTDKKRTKSNEAKTNYSTFQDKNIAAKEFKERKQIAESLEKTMILLKKMKQTNHICQTTEIGKFG